MTVKIFGHLYPLLLLGYILLLLLGLLLPVVGTVQHVLVVDLVRHVLAALALTYKEIINFT